ncbi:hypothetical protein I5M27_01670 [Adhaeribacter sp. BT258]|uniref:DUF5362 domain-containing protein n=1 Tax=Adhaeribacter terrigena TaxID=2793070 RepID=A0ABS1BZ64_9BACT|nr:hypothetical protein [Adhaeribacter terrigena]MBK0401673.1 hypothetical protein [Adhaeribacter terrigena]
MENYETAAATPLPEETLQVNAPIKNYLSESAKWARFLGIVGFTFVGFMVVGAFFMGTFMNFLGRNQTYEAGDNPFASGAASLAMAGYILLLALLYFFPSLYLYQFGTKTQNALRRNEQFDLTAAFSRLKSFFKFFGILTAVFLVLYGAGLLMMLVFGAFMNGR